MPVAASIRTIALPLSPPQQGPGPVSTGLTPTEPLPTGHSLEAVTGQWQTPVKPHPGMNIHKTVTKLLQFSLINTLPLGHAP
jgi:hypothetical protein